MLADKGVGIEQQYIFALTLMDGNVVGTRKTEIAHAGDEAHIGKERLKKLHAVVMRMVVNDNHFRRDAIKAPLETVKTLAKIMLHIIVDNNYRKFYLVHLHWLFGEFALASRLCGIDKAEAYQPDNRHVTKGNLQAEPIIK